jgi:F0F1-type ATP synthase epsilon subunit
MGILPHHEILITELKAGELRIVQNEKVAEAAVKCAEELLKSNTLEGEELEATQAALARSLAQIHVKRRRRSG